MEPARDAKAARAHKTVMKRRELHERKFWLCVASSSSIQQRAGQSRQVRELSDDLAYQGPLTSSLLTS